MEKDPSCYQDAAKMVAGDGLSAEGTETQLDDFVGAHPDYNEEEEEQKYYRRKRLGVIKNVLAASLAGTLTYGVYLGLLQMQLILHYDETYREVKYSNIQLEDIDRKVLMGINVTPVAALLYTPVLIRYGAACTPRPHTGTGAHASPSSPRQVFRHQVGHVSGGGHLRPLRLQQLLGALLYAGALRCGHRGCHRSPLGFHGQLHHADGPEVLRVRQLQGGARARAAAGTTGRLQHLHHHLPDRLLHLLPPKLCLCSDAHALLPQQLPLPAQPHALRGQALRDPEPRHAARLQQDGAAEPAPQHQPHHCGECPDGGRLPCHAGGECQAGQGMGQNVGSASPTVARQVLVLCGSAYRPTEEIDLRSIGWGNIFQLPFKHMRDYRLRHLFPLFIYSGFEVLFVCTGFSLNYGVCALGLENLAYLLMAYGFSASACSSLALCMLRLRRQIPLLAGALIHAALLVTLFCWAPEPRHLVQAPLLYSIAVLWGMGSALNKTGISILLGVLYEDKERQDFVFTIYHWWQALAIFTVYLWSGLPMKVSMAGCHLRCLPGSGGVQCHANPLLCPPAGQAFHHAADAGGGSGGLPLDGAQGGTACGIPPAPHPPPAPQDARLPLLGG
ncbi:PREDICTED: protein unc-93 homolog B1 isoform X1 [Haliaeetus leucocephalus]|uniref:protein unc-93 homolog B1 isoform X1 n=1 Tax=Haliaeetus leucocephalus TaxID=52644 RepID=UPI00053CD196|nr:PREDICTED: protein unc-93 homolog B1 isoform X1 [Haliaeetus leucocephalus]